MSKRLAFDGADHKVHRYSLMRAILIVRQLENTPTRAKVFADIRANNRLIGFVSAIYDLGGALFLRRFMLLLYMLKCAGSVGDRPVAGTHRFAIATFMNEVHTVDRASRYFDGEAFHLIRPRTLNCLKPAQWLIMLRLIAAAPRMWFVLGRLARTQAFMPACRTASVLAFYVRFGDLASPAKRDCMTLIVSNYSPEALALAAVGHTADGQVVYANHAPVPRNGPWVPPVFANVSMLYGAIFGETYALKSRIHTRQVLVGQPGTVLPMQYVDAPNTVGIFLTSLTNKQTIDRLIAQIKAIYPTVSILIRHHPVALLETDLSDIEAKYNGISVTIGSPLDEDIAACDAIICGNSGVILNALRGGRPVAFVAELDGLPFDYNGFFETGLVYSLKDWSAQTFPALNDFYRSPAWEQIMRGYDASYGEEKTAHDEKVRAALTEALSR